MRNNNSDRFEGISKETSSQVNDNFFLQEETFPAEKLDYKKFEPARRLNDYDFNLLKEDAYKDVSDDLFKLEYKISRIEDNINELEAQIQAAFDIHDEALIDELINRKALLEEEYESLVAIYNEKSLSAKISDSIANVFGEKALFMFNLLKKHTGALTDSIVEKLPKRFSSVIELKKSLIKLENINKSVDELVNLNIPYGENVNKYDQLSKYIIKANSIQNKIAQYFNNK